jgi:hypothetical protein
MFKTLLIVTYLSTGAVDVRVFDTYLSCYQFAQQHAGAELRMQCVPMQESVANNLTQKFYAISRLLGIFSQQNQ